MNNTQNIEHLLRGLKEDRDAMPSELFRTNARIRVLNTVTSAYPLRLSWYKRPRIFGYTVGTAIATVVLSVGTVYAAQLSAPNSTLYPLKVLSEQAALTLSPTESLKTTVANSIISRRIDEVEQAQLQGDAKEIDKSISNFQDDVAALQKRKDISPGVIEKELNRHESFLNSINRREEENKKSEGQKESDHDDRSPVETTPSPQPTFEQKSPTPLEQDIRLPQVEGATSRQEED